MTLHIGALTRNRVFSIILIAAILFTAIFVSCFFLNTEQTDPPDPAKCYVGVSYCGNSSAEARLLIDKVKGYTNLLVLQSGPVSKNETATNEICAYAVAAGLKIIVYFGDLNYRVLTNQTMWRIDWVKTAKQRWNDSLLGVYYYDEPGGIFLETDWRLYPRVFNSNATYDSAANHYVQGTARDRGMVLLKNNSVPVVVSDFALYWWDYLAGYDVVLAQVGWNHTMQQDIALVRGAARLQNKLWGVMITWTYTVPPYLADGRQILSEMVDAYKAGAKYIVLFDYPQLEGNPYGILKDEHFQALESFWAYVTKNSAGQFGYYNAEAALILPKNYGWGMRSPTDRIWYWGYDAKSGIIWDFTRSLLQQYGFGLDIAYDDPNFPISGKYSRTYYWNETVSASG